MEQSVAADGGSGNSGDFSHVHHHHHHHHREISETLRFQEEIQSLIRENLLELDPETDGGANNSSSFTALLGLPPNQAMELLHPPHQLSYHHNHYRHQEIVPTTSTLEARRSVVPNEYLQFRCSPTFPSNVALVERAARYSVFASEGSSSPETSVVPSNSENNSSPKVKCEPADDSDLKSPPKQKRANGKRKPSEKCVKPTKRYGKKSKNGGNDVGDKKDGGDDEKLPYVHVRARRGQATDSHSLAERARREKINARMKLLQELVPGCNKISGTALVLDEIINHVQSLQRQVEFLSMRLAAVNPRIDFGGIESFLPSDNATVTRCNNGGVGLVASIWPDIQVDGGGVRPQQQQIWQVDLLPSQQQTSSSSSLWDRDDNHQNQHHGFINHGPSLIGLDYTNPVSVETNQLKTEM